MRTSSYISRKRTRTPRNFPPINIFPHERGDFYFLEKIVLFWRNTISVYLSNMEKQHNHTPKDGENMAILGIIANIGLTIIKFL